MMQKDVTEAALEMLNERIEKTTAAAFQGIQEVNKSADRLASLAPGQQGAYLGFVLIAIVVVTEYISIFLPSKIFDADLTSLLVWLGVLLVICGAAFNTIVSVIQIRGYNRRIEAISAAQQAQLQEVATEEKSLWRQLLGKQGG